MVPGYGLTGIGLTRVKKMNQKYRYSDAMDTLKGRLAREHETLVCMTRIYCEQHHAGHPDADLCGDCAELMRYAERRLAKCPYGERKPTCAKCPIHCYKPAQREQAREIILFQTDEFLGWMRSLDAVGLIQDYRRQAEAVRDEVLLRALKLQKRAARVGFDWPSTSEVIDKIVEEARELHEARETMTEAEVFEEFGDLLFVIANLARHLENHHDRGLVRSGTGDPARTGAGAGE